MKKNNSLFKVIINYYDLYYFLSSYDVASRFRSSRLGILWLVIQQLMFALGISLVWSNVFAIDIYDFVPFLTLGLSLWGIIMGSMTEGGNAFLHAQYYIKQFPLPYSVFILRTLLTQFLYFGISILTTFIVLSIFGKLSLLGIIYAIPGMVVLCIYCYSATALTAYLCLRYRDLNHALSGIFGLIFLITPIIFSPELLIQKGISIAIYLNPFASLIEIVRYPILNVDFANLEHYFIGLGFSLCLLLVQIIIQKRWGRFVPFWI